MKNQIHSNQRYRSRQIGQAMTEFLVAAMFFLVPLFIAISALGKFIDVQHTADMVARYSTWERTVWYQKDNSKFNGYNGPNTKTSSEIHSEAGARILNDRSTSTTVIKSTDASATGFINGISPSWRDPAGQNYFNSYSDFSSAVVMKERATGLDAESKFAAPTGISLPPNTLATTEVSLKNTAQGSAPYERLWKSPAWMGLEFNAKGAIVSNTWAANGSGATKKVVSDLVPTTDPVGGSLLTGAATTLSSWDPMGISGLQVGKIAPDEVPSDRLK